MNYLNIYNSLMKSRNFLPRSKGGDVYFEAHHITPKWLGGSNQKDNLVLLTAKEHYLAHLLLWKHYRDRPSALAYHRMCKSNNQKQQRITNGRHFEAARIAFVETQSGDKNWIRINGSPCKGKPSPLKGRKMPKPHLFGNNNPSKRLEVRALISKKLAGKKQSIQHVEKLVFIYKAKPKTECPYCSKSYDYRNYARWHGNNCKVNRIEVQ